MATALRYLLFSSLLIVASPNKERGHGRVCDASSFSVANLSALAMQGQDKMWKANTTAALCLQQCCASSSCTAWNHHLSSIDETHHPGECWLSDAQTISAVPSLPVDVWVGGARVPVSCYGRPCATPITPCNGSNYTQCRDNLIKHVFNTTTGTLPSRSTPDYIEDWQNWSMHGLPGPGQGTGVGNVSWRMALKKLVWTIGKEGYGMREGMLRLNATVWYSRNTSGAAPSNSPPAGYGTPTGDSPHCPTKTFPGYDSYNQQSDTLVIHHNGHSPCSGSVPARKTNCTDCTPNYDTVQDWLNEVGYDVFEMAMPLHGCNRIVANTSCPLHCVDNPARGFDCNKCSNIGSDASLDGSHQWFEQFEEFGDDVMRYFLEPVILAINYAVNVLKYKHIIMIGLSGGGWTTTISAALDKRITLSIPIAGSVPKFASKLYTKWIPDLPEGSTQQQGTGGDFEQNMARPMYSACGWACLYVLAALEPDRTSLQMLHEHDSCCFATSGLHDGIAEYNSFVQGELVKEKGGWFQTAANWGNFHEVNYRDKTTIGTMIERLRRSRGIERYHFCDLPFDILHNGPSNLCN
eukprot:m.2767 g.2767  ORF g.2767 m.2767 type:complete len:578 (-) comp2586_c0_seq1:73-1806(-)